MIDFTRYTLGAEWGEGREAVQEEGQRQHALRQRQCSIQYVSSEQITTSEEQTKRRSRPVPSTSAGIQRVYGWYLVDFDCVYDGSLEASIV